MIRAALSTFIFAGVAQSHNRDLIHKSELAAERACGRAFVRIDKHLSVPSRTKEHIYQYTLSEVDWHGTGSTDSYHKVGTGLVDISQSPDYWCVTPGAQYYVEMTSSEFNPMVDVAVSFCGGPHVSPDLSQYFTLHLNGVCETYKDVSDYDYTAGTDWIRAAAEVEMGFSMDYSNDFSNDFSADLIPTSAPTTEPTTAPTTVPTTPPTTAPTVSPSAAPSHAPTTIFSTLQATNRSKACYADCTYPGNTQSPDTWTGAEYCAFYESTECGTDSIADYSCVPSCLSTCPDVFCETFSTLDFTCDGDHHDSSLYRNKTALDNACIASYSSGADTVTLLEFDSLVSYDGVNSSYFDSAAAKDSAIFAMAESMSGVTASNINITNITDVIFDRRMRRRLDTTDETVITYNIKTTVEALGYTSSDASAAYTSLTDQVSSSVSSGQFLTLFKTAASAASLPVPSSMTVPSSGLSFTPAKVVSAVTTSPTAAPSVSADTSGSKHDDDDDLSAGAIAGIVIGSVAGVALIVGVAYLLMSRLDKTSVGLASHDPLNDGHDVALGSGKHQDTSINPL